MQSTRYLIFTSFRGLTTKTSHMPEPAGRRGRQAFRCFLKRRLEPAQVQGVCAEHRDCHVACKKLLQSQALLHGRLRGRALAAAPAAWTQAARASETRRPRPKPQQSTGLVAELVSRHHKGVPLRRLKRRSGGQEITGGGARTSSA